MIDFLLRRRMILNGSGSKREPIDNRYFIIYIIGNNAYLVGIKHENWWEDYQNNIIEIPDEIEYNGVTYPIVIDSEGKIH